MRGSIKAANPHPTKHCETRQTPRKLGLVELQKLAEQAQELADA
jgi:hypothetical protein